MEKSVSAKPGSRYSSSPEESATQAGTSPDDPISAYLMKQGIPVTRENWIDLNWVGEPPDPWTQEDEQELPESLQLEDLPRSEKPSAMKPPERKNFPSQEEYEEAKGFFHSRIGKLQKMAGVTRTAPSGDSPAASPDSLPASTSKQPE